MEVEKFYRHKLFMALSQGLISPFIPIFALSLGATNFLIGELSSLTTLTNLIFQIIFMFWIVKVRKKNLVLFLSTTFWALSWLIVGISKNTYELIAYLCIQAIFMALVTLTWTELFVISIPSYKRGRIVSNLNYFNEIGLLISTLVSGYALMKYGFNSFLFVFSAIFGFLAAINFLSLEETNSIARSRFKKINLGELRKNKNFYRFLKAYVLLTFAVGVASPFFTVQLVKGFNATTMDVALISVIGSLASLAVYKPWGYIVDFIGRKPVIMANLVIILFYPLVYAFSPHILFIYLFTIIGSISWAGINIATFTYFSESIGKEKASEYIALYNFSAQAADVIGRFIGGVIAEQANITTVFIVSFLLRVVSLLSFNKLREMGGKVEEIAVEHDESFSFMHTIGNTIAMYSKLFEVMRERGKRRRRSIYTTLEKIIKFLSKIMKRR